MRQAETIVSIALWLATALCCAISLALFRAAGFALLGNGITLPLLFFAGGALTIPLMQRPQTYRLASSISALLQIVVLSGAAMLATYAAATSGHPLRDQWMIAADRAIGFDWTVYARAVAVHPSAARLLELCYATIFTWPLVVVATLSVTGTTSRLHQYVLATMIALVVTITFFYFLPVTTAWVHLGLSAQIVEQYRYLCRVDQDWVRDLLAVRAGTLRSLAWGEGSGLIGFPSYHAASAGIVMWSLWAARRVRWIVVVANAGLIAATPVFGGHYLVDVIAGSIVAVVSIVAAKAMHAAMLTATLSRAPVAAFATT